MMIVLLIFLLLVGTGCLVFWNLLMFRAKGYDEEEIAHYTYRNLNEKYEKLIAKAEADTVALEKLDGIFYQLRKLTNDPKSSEKAASKLKKKMDKLDNGDFSGINFLVLPGYGFIKAFGINADNKFFAKIMEIYAELKGREFAMQNARYLFASMASAALGGSGITIALGVLITATMGEDMLGMIFYLGGPVISVVGAMSSYGGIQDKLKKRRVEIMIDFPQVVSELALLTSSGMEIYNAWAKVAGERDGELYREMRHTSKEVMEYGVDPSAAFEMFIRRCGTKETARLGTSILQSIKRSPEELSNFLIGLSQEAWDDRKHNARRMGAAAQSKLLIPMMLIFLGIIFLVMAPVVMEMGNMGF